MTSANGYQVFGDFIPTICASGLMARYTSLAISADYSMPRDIFSTSVGGLVIGEKYKITLVLLKKPNQHCNELKLMNIKKKLLLFKKYYYYYDFHLLALS